MAAEDGDFDLSAASWRAAVTDESAFIEALAGRLEQALPGRVRVSRAKRLFGNRAEPNEIRIGFDNVELVLHFDRRRGISAERARVVRGVRLKTETLDLEAWLGELSRYLSELARAHEDLRRNLEQFLL